MSGEYDIVGFVSLLTKMALGVAALQHEALKHGAIILQREAKRVIGTYDYGWPQLAASTQSERSRLGYAANEPLLRDGTMRESIEYTVGFHEAEVGSDEDVAVWQELGTDRIPARSFLMGAAVHKGSEIAEEMGLVYYTYLIEGGEIARALPASIP